jgi:hypothetical protein
VALDGRVVGKHAKDPVLVFALVLVLDLGVVNLLTGMFGRDLRGCVLRRWLFHRCHLLRFALLRFVLLLGMHRTEETKSDRHHRQQVRTPA